MVTVKQSKTGPSTFYSLAACVIKLTEKYENTSFTSNSTKDKTKQQKILPKYSPISGSRSGQRKSVTKLTRKLKTPFLADLFLHCIKDGVVSEA